MISIGEEHLPRSVPVKFTQWVGDLRHHTNETDAMLNTRAKDRNGVGCGEKYGFGLYFPEALVLRPHGLEFSLVRMKDLNSVRFISSLMLRALEEESRKM